MCPIVRQNSSFCISHSGKEGGGDVADITGPRNWRWSFLQASAHSSGMWPGPGIRPLPHHVSCVPDERQAAGEWGPIGTDPFPLLETRLGLVVKAGGSLGDGVQKARCRLGQSRSGNSSRCSSIHGSRP